MLGLELIDWAVIIVYLVGITFIGLWAVKRVRSAASFFIGDRKFGKVMMAFFMFGSGTHSDQAVSVASKTYQPKCAFCRMFAQQAGRRRWYLRRVG